jgi:hypothetical protein
MISCLISLIVIVIVALIIIYALEAIVGTLLPLPPPIFMLIRLLVGLLVLLYALDCLLASGALRGLRYG